MDVHCLQTRWNSPSTFLVSSDSFKNTFRAPLGNVKAPLVFPLKRNKPLVSQQHTAFVAVCTFYSCFSYLSDFDVELQPWNSVGLEALRLHGKKVVTSIPSYKRAFLLSYCAASVQFSANKSKQFRLINGDFRAEAARFLTSDFGYFIVN